MKKPRCKECKSTSLEVTFHRGHSYGSLSVVCNKCGLDNTIMITRHTVKRYANLLSKTDLKKAIEAMKIYEGIDKYHRENPNRGLISV